MGRRREDLAERLWPDRLQDLQDALTRSFGVPTLFVDPSGRPLAACESLSDFCRHFTRAIAIFRPCLECGRAEGAEQTVQSNVAAARFAPVVHVCPLGARDVAIPILSAGEIIGHLLSAQVTVRDEPENADAAGAAPVARDPEEYAALISRLPRRSRAELDTTATGLSVVASMIGLLAAARHRNLRLAERIREQSRWIQDQAVNDAVTGVANRRRFCQALEAEIARARRYRRSLSVAAVDIEGFRQVNEEFGHDVGDAVLRAVAQSLASTLRQTDLVGRVGGDEFALLLPETARHEAMIALARVKANIEDLNASGELPVEVSVAFAVSEHVTKTEEMLSAALDGARRATSAGSLVGP